MHKEYKHPSPYRPDFNYLEGIHATDKHIKDITKSKPHPGQAQHLGGTASYNSHLKELHYGKCEGIKKDLKRVLDYLFYYSKTDHDIYHFLAEDALMHMDQMVSDIQDPKEKEHIRYFVDCVREYMHWLKTNKPNKKNNQNREYSYDEEYEYEDDEEGQEDDELYHARNLDSSTRNRNRSTSGDSNRNMGGGNRSRSGSGSDNRNRNMSGGNRSGYGSDNRNRNMSGGSGSNYGSGNPDIRHAAYDPMYDPNHPSYDHNRFLERNNQSYDPNRTLERNNPMYDPSYPIRNMDTNEPNNPNNQPKSTVNL